MPRIIEARAYGQFVPGVPEIWMPDTNPILPERRLLVPEPSVKFDKLTPAQMGEAHGRIAERPPFEIVDRLRGLRFHADMGIYERDEKFVISGREYSSAYAENIGIWLSKRGAADQDLERLSQASLAEPKQLQAYINGMERVSYEYNIFKYPEGYGLGFTVGVARDFGFIPTDVPANLGDYYLFLSGLSGREKEPTNTNPKDLEPKSSIFQLGKRIHEIVEADPLPQAV